MSVSFLEIYNEQLKDLLLPGSTAIRLMDDPASGVVVRGAREEVVSSPAQAFEIGLGQCVQDVQINRCGGQDLGEMRQAVLLQPDLERSGHSRPRAQETMGAGGSVTCPEIQRH
jgi:hypothetical protein